MDLTDIPEFLIEEILSRNNLDELTGLCASNSMFREHCNQLAKKHLKKMFKDPYSMYLKLMKLSQYKICLSTYADHITYKNARTKIDIITAVTEMIRNDTDCSKSMTDITYEFDNQNNPSLIVINFFDHTDRECEKSFFLHIYGEFTRKEAEKLIEDIADVFRAEDVE